MKSIRDFKVTQTRLYRADEIPFRSLSAPSAENRLRTEFRLKRLPAPANLNLIGEMSLFFINGEFIIGEKAVLIDQLAIEQRRIVLTVTGTSEHCNTIYDQLTGILKEIDNRSPALEYEPLVVVQESACVVELDAPLSQLFTGSPIEKLMDSVSGITDAYGCQLKLFPSSVRIRVKYEDIPAKLTKSHVSLVEKDITVELRAGTSIEENTYFISSPSSSDNHLRIIAAIEAAFT